MRCPVFTLGHQSEIVTQSADEMMRIDDPLGSVVPGTQPPEPRSRAQRPTLGDLPLAFVLVAPNVALLTWFTYRPLMQSIRLSLERWDLVSPRRVWVGFGNYRDWWHDPVSRSTVRNTFVFTGVTVTITILLGLVLAVTLDRKRRGSSFARGALFAPYLVPGAAVAIVWYFVFDPRFGLLAAALRNLGISSPNWYNDPTWAMAMVCFAYIWKTLGYTAVLYLAGLQSIAPELYEAADLDGARWWGRMRVVTLPALRPTTTFIAVTSFLSAMQAFDIIYVMTQGGPLDGTRTLSYQIYDEAFVRFRVGMASAVATVLFLALLVATIVQVRLLDRREAR